jgi:Tripartite tricarboxylate transporter TctB family
VSDQDDGGKRPIGADLIIPVLASVFAAYYVTTVWHLPWAAKANGLLLAGALFPLVAIFFIKAGASILRGETSLSMRPLFSPWRLQSQRLALVLLMLAFIVVIPYFGFSLTIFAFLLGTMLLLGERSPAKLLGISAIASLTGYFLFIALLDTPFPHGPVEMLLGRVF